MRVLMAAVGALSLVACNAIGGADGPALPPVKQGAQAPQQLTRPSGQAARDHSISEQDRQGFIGQVNGYLDQIQNGNAEGWTGVQGFPTEIITMGPGTDHRWQVSLTGGTEYRFVGACDQDCSDIDIELVDFSTGGVVASDVLPDDFPVTRFTPPADGRYIVRLSMKTCTTAPCFAGVRVLQAPPQAAAATTTATTAGDKPGATQTETPGK